MEQVMNKSAKSKAPTRSGIVSARRTQKRKKGGTQRPSVAQPSALAGVQSKLSNVIALLRRRDGTTIEEMMTATGWQAHSIRGAMSGVLKGKLHLDITSQRIDGVRRYRIAR
jgi:hypothetical protein